ncbi:hypothetical protein [Catellatospora methionotrophica]|uniref:hypothetical protein n=1 Tax=Catellatospora methionotrophica TaxID=121620 RepID=UPI003405C51D
MSFLVWAYRMGRRVGGATSFSARGVSAVHGGFRALSRKWLPEPGGIELLDTAADLPLTPLLSPGSGSQPDWGFHAAREDSSRLRGNLLDYLSVLAELADHLPDGARTFATDPRHHDSQLAT